LEGPFENFGEELGIGPDFPRNRISTLSDSCTLSPKTAKWPLMKTWFFLMISSAPRRVASFRNAKNLLIRIGNAGFVGSGGSFGFGCMLAV
jgi:hypothetical protein